MPPAMAGTVAGQPPRKRLKIDDDPFGAVGDYAGSFLIKSAVEFCGGYDTNPGRLNVPQGLPFWVVAPEFLVGLRLGAPRAGRRSARLVHRLRRQPAADRSMARSRRRRPISTGRISSATSTAASMSRATPGCSAQARLLVATDNPGSPNVQAGLARYPIYTTFGGTFGVDQNFNRLEISAGATVDRTVYQKSTLTDGATRPQ